MNRVIVTGATSMLGIATIEECIRNGKEVVAILRKDTKKEGRLPKSALITKIYANSFDYPDISYNGEADTLYHYMWEYSHKGGRDNPLLQVRNIETTMNVIEYAHRLGCKRMIFAGSQAEYGGVAGAISETMPPSPHTAYGISKYATFLLADKLCSLYEIDYIWARVFSVYGKNDNDDTMINATLNKLLRGEKVSFSSGKQMWNYLNEEDAGKIFFMLGNDKIESGVYNIANPVNQPLKEYITELLNLFPNAEYEFAKEDNVRINGIEADTSKLYAQIGRFNMIPFSEGIKKIIAAKNGGNV